MTHFMRKLLATATADAIDGSIVVERWKHCWTPRFKGYWGLSDIQHMWSRKTSARALLAKERDYYFKVETTAVDDGTVWNCTYKTDMDGSYCRYVFRTPGTRDFYEQAVGARIERAAISAEIGHEPRPASQMGKGRL
jgi:hypothetical protein